MHIERGGSIQSEYTSWWRRRLETGFEFSILIFWLLSLKKIQPTKQNPQNTHKQTNKTQTKKIKRNNNWEKNPENNKHQSKPTINAKFIFFQTGFPVRESGLKNPQLL